YLTRAGLRVGQLAHPQHGGCRTLTVVPGRKHTGDLRQRLFGCSLIGWVSAARREVAGRASLLRPLAVRAYRIRPVPRWSTSLHTPWPDPRCCRLKLLSSPPSIRTRSPPWPPAS